MADPLIPAALSHAGGDRDAVLRLDVLVAGFGQSDLWQLAGQGSYERGEQYVNAVMDLRDVPNGVRATVHGSWPYLVQLSWADGELLGDCSCPVGSEGAFCKHCVAVGLVLIDEAEREDADESGEPALEDDLRGYLESLDHEALVDLLCEHVATDDILHLKLTLRAATDRENPDIAALRRQIYRSLRTRGRLSYEGGLEYADRAEYIVEALDDLIEAGHAAEVVRLAQQVTDLLTEAIEQADDSSDEICSVRDQAIDLYEQARASLSPEDAEDPAPLSVLPSTAGT